MRKKLYRWANDEGMKDDRRAPPKAEERGRRGGNKREFIKEEVPKKGGSVFGVLPPRRSQLVRTRWSRRVAAEETLGDSRVV